MGSSARKHLEQLLLRLDYSGYFADVLQRERPALKGRWMMRWSIRPSDIMVAEYKR